MKIKCTMEEYTKLIRMCQRGKDLSECQGCVMGVYMVKEENKIPQYSW